MVHLFRHTPTMIEEKDALPGRETPIVAPGSHYVLGTELSPPYPEPCREVVIAMGCFWGAERIFWQVDGVYVTAVGYCGGYTPNPTYEEVCSGRTGHAESVLVVFDPSVVRLERVLQLFFEGHDPTQLMGQGNDIGTQYRSALFLSSANDIVLSRDLCTRYGELLSAAGHPSITTEIAERRTFYFAEDYHQQYLAKNPLGYCGLQATGVSCPVGLSS